MEIRRTTTKVFKIDGITIDMFVYDEDFRRTRSRFRKKYGSCFKCGHKFEDGEMMSIAFIEHDKNQALCHACAVEVKNV